MNARCLSLVLLAASILPLSARAVPPLHPLSECKPYRSGGSVEVGRMFCFAESGRPGHWAYRAGICRGRSARGPGFDFQRLDDRHPQTYTLRDCRRLGAKVLEPTAAPSSPSGPVLRP
jgi:hypothetical protein